MTDPSVVPLAGVASQTLNVTLGNQPCSVDVFTKHIQVPVSPGGIPLNPPTPPLYGAIDPIFLNLRLNDAPVVSGILARSNVQLIRGFCAQGVIFSGDLSFYDTEGNEEPQWAGLGSRWLLLYWADVNKAGPYIAYLTSGETGQILTSGGVPLIP